MINFKKIISSFVISLTSALDYIFYLETSLLFLG